MNRRATLLFVAEVLVVAAYAVAFLAFTTQSRDFIVVRNNATAADAARRLPLQPSAEIAFGSGQQTNSLLGSGWHPAERDGVWSEATAFVYLSIRPAGSDLHVSLAGRAHLAGGRPSVEITATVDDQPVATWAVRYDDPPAALGFTVPAAALADGPIELRLDVDRAVSPADLGLGDDPRTLGFFLQRIVLSPASR